MCVSHTTLLKAYVLNCPDSMVCGAYMGPTWGDRTQLGPVLAAWSLLSGWVFELKNSASVRLGTCNTSQEICQWLCQRHFVVNISLQWVNSCESFTPIPHGCDSSTEATACFPGTNEVTLNDTENNRPLPSSIMRQDSETLNLLWYTLKRS